MKQWLLILFVICASVFAMVPRDRRALPAEEVESTTKPICASKTPCAWTIYNQREIIKFNITNTYCICGPDEVCNADENDSSIYTYIHHCLPAKKSAES